MPGGLSGLAFIGSTGVLVGNQRKDLVSRWTKGYCWKWASAPMLCNRTSSKRSGCLYRALPTLPSCAGVFLKPDDDPLLSPGSACSGDDEELRTWSPEESQELSGCAAALKQEDVKRDVKRLIPAAAAATALMFARECPAGELRAPCACCGRGHGKWISRRTAATSPTCITSWWSGPRNTVAGVWMFHGNRGAAQKIVVRRCEPRRFEDVDRQRNCDELGILAPSMSRTLVANLSTWRGLAVMVRSEV
ncbi:hypothetical protein SELMODRAFT_422327 [Selaginella moellendorffii]|uniref:Uncharacterized protein n=1 Tax=Selaginella moellendorffii TaxID=88036 RepID=D8SI22_SELML|nr:hypothetical protein SELMODRAFT_422327 [Selaginella moellendorffii]